MAIQPQLLPFLALLACLGMRGVLSCTRVVYVGPEGSVKTGRTMDWNEETNSTVLAVPRAMLRHGMAGPVTLVWQSKYSSLVVQMYAGIGAVDGFNEKGLAGNLLAFPEADYGDPSRGGRPKLSAMLLLQYALDNYASVAEAVADLRRDHFNLVGTLLPTSNCQPEAATSSCRPTAGHMSLSDASGDNAIVEFVNGGQVKIYHSKEYTVMTNSPPYEEQLENARHWAKLQGRSLPGTSRPSDRFVRALHYINSVPKSADPEIALAQLRGILRAVSTPLGMLKVDSPEMSATHWFSIIDHAALRLYYEDVRDPAAFWIDFSSLDLSPGSPVLRLDLWLGWGSSSSPGPLRGRAGDITDLLRPVPADRLPLGLGGDGSCDDMGTCLQMLLASSRRAGSAEGRANSKQQAAARQ